MTELPLRLEEALLERPNALGGLLQPTPQLGDLVLCQLRPVPQLLEERIS